MRIILSGARLVVGITGCKGERVVSGGFDLPFRPNVGSFPLETSQQPTLLALSSSETVFFSYAYEYDVFDV